MLKPPNKMIDYESVKVDEWLNGEIVDIKDDPERKTNFLDENGKQKVIHAVQIIFDLDDYQFPHRTRWLTFSYSEKANLYKDILIHLVDNCHEYMDFDLELIKGMKVKTMWAESKGKDGKVYQNLAMIRPISIKPKAEDIAREPVNETAPETTNDTEIPF